MEYLFKAWQEFSNAVKAASHLLLLSDYDGTLTPIVSRPEDALLASSVREKLQALSRKPSVSVGVISGRTMAEIKSLVSLDGIYYAGNHGLEIQGPNIDYINETARVTRPLMKELAGEFTKALENIDGVIIEDKEFSLSIHYRLVDEQEENTVAATFRRLTRPLLNKNIIRVSSGKKVYEIRPPVDWHKGKAVGVIIREIKSVLSPDRILSVYIGDDTTDEDAFKVIHRPDGWSIFVGKDNPLSSAGYYLDSTSEVEQFLTRLEQQT
jgi:trehalose 6-phosphate phosphatase